MKGRLSLAAHALILLVLASCSLFDYSGVTPKKYALVYGITRYAMSASPGSSPNLSYPDNDASAFAALLESEGFVIVKSRWVTGAGNVIFNGQDKGFVGTPTMQVDGFTITDVGTGSGDAPSKDNIIADIQSLSSVAGQNDLVLIYFSGHGMMDTETPPSNNQWIVPYGGLVKFPGGYYGYSDTSIRDDELGSYLKESSPTPRKVLILDTCNSGGFIGNQLEADNTPPFSTGATPAVTPATIAEAIANYAAFATSQNGISPYDAQVMAAAGRDEFSYESLDFDEHGVMTYYLLKTAGSADLNNDGAVTVLEAFAFMKAGIDTGWNKSPDTIRNGWYFEPHVSGGPVDFVLF